MFWVRMYYVIMIDVVESVYDFVFFLFFIDDFLWFYVLFYEK